MNKLIKGVGVGLAAWCGAWLGAGWLILDHLFPEENKKKKNK